MALKLQGERKIALDRELVWRLLNDPEVLQETIPGCEKLTRIAEDKYELGLNLLVGSVSGNYKGTVELSDKKPIDSYDLALVGEGSIGFVKGAAHFVLTPDGDGTVITYTGEAEVGGLVAGVGSRMLGGVAKYMIGRFFKAFEKYIAEHGVSQVRPDNPADSGAANARE